MGNAYATPLQNMKVLLIYPTLVGEAPMPLAMLAPIFKEANYEVYTMVNTFKHPLTNNDFIQRAKELNVDLVGISMLTFEVKKTHDLISRLNREGFRVIVGGPHPTDCPEECIEAGAYAVVVGEGEAVLKKWLENPKPGILDREPPVDLNTLPMPDISVFDLETFTGDDGLIRGFHRVYTSRGCPGMCTFCDWQVFKQNFRFYPIDKIINEIKHRRDKYGIKSFSIADDCFTVGKSRVLEFCKKIKPLGVEWRANSRANLANKEMFEAMKDANCHSVAFGLESGDPETLKRVRKMVTLEQNIKAPWMAHEAGLEVYGCLMTGFPWETPENVQNQIDFMHKVWDAVSLFQVSGSLMPFPGTEIYREYAKKYGFEKYWIKDKFQKCGIQVYQNYINPLSVSTFYQRYLFDDTYVQEEYFFPYTKAYKRAVRKMALEIGRHNLPFMLKSVPKAKLYTLIGRLSMLGYDLFPTLEKKIGGELFHLLHKEGKRSKIEKLRDKRRGIAKKR